MLLTIVAAVYLMIQLQAKPYKHATDDYLATASSFGLLMLFVCSIIFKYTTLTDTEDIQNKMSTEQKGDYVVNNTLLSAALVLSVLGALIASAMRVEGEAVDLYHFTSVIMRSVNEEGRLRIVEMMWELVYADGQVSEFEDNVVWRASDLLGISQRDRIELKHAVAERAGGQVKNGAVGG